MAIAAPPVLTLLGPVRHRSSTIPCPQRPRGRCSGSTRHPHRRRRHPAERKPAHADNNIHKTGRRKLSAAALANLRAVDATAQLAPGTEKARRAGTDELGLVYGTFDLSVSNDGGSAVFWFVEINLGGQYASRRATGILFTRQGERRRRSCTAALSDIFQYELSEELLVKMWTRVGISIMSRRNRKLRFMRFDTWLCRIRELAPERSG